MAKKPKDSKYERLRKAAQGVLDACGSEERKYVPAVRELQEVLHPAAGANISEEETETVPKPEHDHLLRQYREIERSVRAEVFAECIEACQGIVFKHPDDHYAVRRVIQSINARAPNESVNVIAYLKAKAEKAVRERDEERGRCAAIALAYAEEENNERQQCMDSSVGAGREIARRIKGDPKPKDGG